MEEHRGRRRGFRQRFPFPLLLLATFLMTACDGNSNFPGMGSRAMELPEGIPARELPNANSQGARLTARYCSQCHGVPSPQRHSAEDWEATARRMFWRMEHMQHMSRGMMGRMMHRGMADVQAPDAGEKREILAYLREHALASVSEARLPNIEGRERFVRTCSRCHALPAPAQHSTEEWPAVVERMRRNTEKMQVPEIGDAEAETITRYLQRAGRRPQ